MKKIFITGGTGYIGSRLIKKLLHKGEYDIIALCRPGSENKIAMGCNIVYGNALAAASFSEYVRGCDTLVHLVGVAHPSPAKKEEFINIDLQSIQQSIIVAKQNNIKKIVYLSVATYPTKIMKDFQLAKAKGEALLIESKIPGVVVRPWYVIGPGHWWPLLLKPFYWLARFSGKYREAAKKLDTVTIGQMLNTLTHAISLETGIIRYFEVEDIKKF